MVRSPKHRPYVAEALAKVIQRPDELGEFLSMYWKEGRCPIAAQVKKGLAKALQRFDEYQLAKWDGGDVKLRDVLFLCHAKPKNDEQEIVWSRLVNGQLKTPDTWEVAISEAGPSGTAKREQWERLLSENRLGAMALLRNLRNMASANVPERLIRDALATCKVDRVLPFRFISAAKHAPQFEDAIEGAFLRCLESQPKLPGKTILIVDVSGSMYGSRISSKSEMTRAEAACALAALVREVCEYPAIYATAGNDSTRIHQTQRVPARRGFALADAVMKMSSPLGGGGIFLKQVMDYCKEKEGTADRIIVITDEQDCGGAEDSPLKADAFGRKNYLVNVASARYGIGYDKWTHIDGWSEAVLNFIYQMEISQQQ
jgi:hypothetical protein